MKINSITIKNWRSIKETRLDFNNLLILIGGVNSGKSSLLSGIAFFLSPFNLKENDLFQKSIPLEISSEFIDDSGNNCVLSLYKSVDNDDIYFFKETQKNKTALTINEYIDILGNLFILSISSASRLPQEVAQVFIDTLTSYLENNYTLQDISSKYLKELHTEITGLDVNKAVSRYVIFKSIRYLYNFLINHDKKPKNLFIFLENPELFLTPQEERELFDYVIKLSNLGVNILIETHSSRFVGLKQYTSIVMAKINSGISSFFQYKGNLFSGDEIKNFNMNYWINTDRSELFFAKKVILVEGQTDKMVLNYLGKKTNIFKYSYTIIECGSKSLIPQFIKLCNSFKINYIAVYDKDNHFWRNEIELNNSNQKNRAIQHAVNAEIGGFIEFNNDIEEEIYNFHNDKKPSSKNKPFAALKTIMEDNYIIPVTLSNKLKKIWN